MTEQIEMPEESLAPRGAGPQLRLAREKKGLSSKDLADRTRINTRMIDLIEAGDFAALPGRAYAVGFARTLAREVGLNEDEIVAMVRGELNTQVDEQNDRRETYEPGDPARAPSRQLVWFSVFAGMILLVGLFFAARQMFWPAAELPRVVEDQAALDGQNPEQAAAAATSATGSVEFTARGAVWVRFSDAEGNRLMEGAMVPGQSYTVPADANGPQIVTGRPDLLTVTIGGQPVAPLSTEPLTVSDMPVDAASLRARPAPVATTGAPSRAVPRAASGSTTGAATPAPVAPATTPASETPPDTSTSSPTIP